MATSAYIRPAAQDDLNTRRLRDKRFTHHSSSSNHHHPHIRVVRAAAEQSQRPPQRKLREKRRPTNEQHVSDSRTDGTTSDDAGEEIKYSSEEVVDNAVQSKLDQLFKKNELHLASDLEADCEDNNSTDVDTVSVSGSIKHKNGAMEKSLEDEGFYLLSSSSVANVPSVPEKALTSGGLDPEDTVAAAASAKTIAAGSQQQFSLTAAQQHALSAKVRNLEKQLETVLSLNLKLKEENEKLKKIAATAPVASPDQPR